MPQVPNTKRNPAGQPKWEFTPGDPGSGSRTSGETREGVLKRHTFPAS